MIKVSKVSKLILYPKKFTEDTFRKYLKIILSTYARKRLPKLLNTETSNDFLKQLSPNKPNFLYVPWIRDQGDVLLKQLIDDRYQLFAFDLFQVDTQCLLQRLHIAKVITYAPEQYLDVILIRLMPLRKSLTSVIVTFDWHPVMRLIVKACQILDIPTLLIPHESVFASSDLYYKHPETLGSVPQVDYIFGWGSIHHDVFASRGFNVAERYESVGSVKLDIYQNYACELNKELFCELLRLQPKKKICLFVAQPLDSQFIKEEAPLLQQRKAIRDLHDICLHHNFQLLIRMPPNGLNILGRKLSTYLSSQGITGLDYAPHYLVSPAETLFHSDVIVSFNSTMLLEGILLGKPAICTHYASFEPMWKAVGVPSTGNYSELNEAVCKAMNGQWTPDEKGLSWVKAAFGIDEAGSNVAERIRSRLCNFGQELPFKKGRSSVEKIIHGEPLDVIAICSSAVTLAASQKYLKQLLRCQSLISSLPDAGNSTLLTSVDVFCSWGNKFSNSKKMQKTIARALRVPTVYLEDGLIRSFNIGLSGEPGYSVTIDDIAPAYDASQENRLQHFLENSDALTNEQTRCCRKIITKITKEKLSKYNHAPILNLNIGQINRPKILVVDQRYEDNSVVCGMGSSETFEKMLSTALNNYPNHDVLIKLHPDTMTGDKSNYFNSDLLDRYSDYSNLYKIDFEINPYCLFEQVEKVFVCTSGVGFEALMAGKEVHCFGVPYYANRGLTVDDQQVDHRTKDVTLEKLFYYAHIYLSRYVRPDTGVPCELDEFVDVFADMLKEFRNDVNHSFQAVS